jgi:hypothetical protein
VLAASIDPDTRRLASEALERLQRLEGFSERLQALPLPPARAADRDLPSIRREHRVMEAHGPGRATIDTALAGELETYDHAISRFAKDFVFGARWAPRAIHDARRCSRPIRLPDGPEPWVTLNQSFCFTIELPFEEGQPYPRSEIDDAVRTLRDFAVAIEQATVDASAALRAKVDANLGEARRRARDGQTAEAIDDYRRWDAGDGKKQAIAIERALDAVAMKLRGDKVPPAERKASQRVRVVMEAAVYGWGATIPSEITDLEAADQHEFQRVAEQVVPALTDLKSERTRSSPRPRTPLGSAPSQASQRRH